MKPPVHAHFSRTNPDALLPRFFAWSGQQWRALQAARRVVRADELSWGLVLEDAQRMAQYSRAMDQVATRR